MRGGVCFGVTNCNCFCAEFRVYFVFLNDSYPECGFKKTKGSHNVTTVLQSLSGKVVNNIYSAGPWGESESEIRNS